MTHSIHNTTEERGRGRRPTGDPPPLPRELNKAAIAWLTGLAFFVGIWGWIFLSDKPAIWITLRDLEIMDPIVENRQDWLTPSMQWLNRQLSHSATPAIGWATIVTGLAFRRVRHVLLLLLSLSVVAGISTVVASQILRPRPLGISQIGDWEGFAQPSRPIALLTTALIAAGLTLIPTGPARKYWYWFVAAAITLLGFVQIYVGVDHPSDVLAGATIGVAVCLLFYRMIAPEKVFPIVYRSGNSAHLDVTGARCDAICLGVYRQLGLVVTGVTPVGLAGSAGSTPLRLSQEDGPDLFAKLYARSHLRSDRFYKLFRTLRYGRLEDEGRFSSVRRLVQHEDYMLHVMRRVGIDCMKPYGIVEITPEREYLLVSEFIDGGVEISEAEMTTDLIDAGLSNLKLMWRAGLAHRDIKPANIMVQGERLRLIDVAFAQIRPSPWRQAVDLANMMLVLALKSDTRTVYNRAIRQFTEEEVAEAFAASQGVTLPSALKNDVKHDGRALLEQFRDLAPSRSPISIQRWSLRRLGLTVWVALVGFAIVAILLENLADIGLS